MTDFGTVALVYDFLESQVFGDHLDRAREQYLNTIESQDRVLIVGGGTGSYLKSLLKRNPRQRITFVDSSSDMIKIAKKKTSSPVNVEWFHGSISDMARSRVYDVVVTHFVLDVFTDKELEDIMRRLRELSAGGRWIFTDFYPEREVFWQKSLIRAMYIFFQLSVKLKVNRLPSFDYHFRTNGIHIMEETRFYHKMVVSRLYQVP